MASFPDVQRRSSRSGNPEHGRLLPTRRLVMTLAAVSVAAIGITVATLELATLQRNAVTPASREAVRA